MKLGNEHGAFRAQLVVPEHRQLFDYWLECCAGRAMPCRADISPARMGRLLSGISIINVADNVMQSTFRLAGTRLRETSRKRVLICACDLGAIAQRSVAECKKIGDHLACKIHIARPSPA